MKFTSHLVRGRRLVSSITCSAEHMAQCLNILAQTPGKYDWLKGEAKPPAGWSRGDIHLFRAGAKLGRLAGGSWYVYGYAPDKSDVESACLELRGADHVRQAISLLSSVDDVMCTPAEYRRKWVGLYGSYASGQRSPSELNYATDHGRSVRDANGNLTFSSLDELKAWVEKNTNSREFDWS